MNEGVEVAEMPSLREAARRVVTTDKIVRHRLLNALGCQVFRVAVAEALVRRRRARWRDTLSDVERALLRDGVATIENFTSPDVLQALLEEIERGEREFFTKRPRPDKFGIVRQKIALFKDPDRFPAATRAMLGSQQLLQLAKVGEGWSEHDDFTNHGADLRYERLEQVVEPADVNPERDPEVSSGDMHADTFHYVTKAFLTLDDVTLENSPYTYAIGSHRLTLRRLVWEYRNSLRAEQYETDEYHNRAWDPDQHWLHMQPQPLQVKKNTLIVTNTFGFHRRGSMTKKGALRRMLRLDFRSNPVHR